MNRKADDLAVIEAEDMPDVAANSLSIALGALGWRRKRKIKAVV